MKGKCILCGSQFQSQTIRQSDKRNTSEISCNICGDYEIMERHNDIEQAIEDGRLPAKWILSGLSRKLKEA